MRQGSDLEEIVKNISVDVVLLQEIVFGSDGNAISEHDPSDPGGTTKYGIDQRSHRNLDVERLDLQGAREIYEKEWYNYGIYLLEVPVHAFLVFDAGVNVGYTRAITLLQKCAGFNHQYWDGIIGNKTISETKQVTIDAYCMAWREYYESLPERLKSRFLKGWLARVDHAQRIAGIIQYYAGNETVSAA